METRVLLCTPFDSSGIANGGISIWAKNVYEWSKCVDNIEIDVLPMNRSVYVGERIGFIKRIRFGVYDYLEHLFQLRTMLRNKPFDIVHLCTSGSLGFIKDILFLYIVKMNKKRAVLHFHFGRIPEIVASKGWELVLLKLVCKRSDGIIVLDKKSQECLLSLGFENTYLIPNPLSDGVVNRVMHSKISRNMNRIVFVGHYEHSKGIIDLVKACVELEGIQLHLIGKPIEGVVEEIKRIATAKNNGNWLHILGEMYHEAVIDEMLSSSVFCLPSYTEGFPNVILESMATACKIVSTSVGAIPEMLGIGTDSPCGVCIAPGNVTQLTRALFMMLHTDVDFGGRARLRVTQSYSIQTVFSKLIKIWCINNENH